MDGNLKNLEEISASLKRFGFADYSVFISMLAACCLVGLYFGWTDYKKRQNSKNVEQGGETDNYLMGGRNMQVFPVGELDVLKLGRL